VKRLSSNKSELLTNRRRLC